MGGRRGDEERGGGRPVEPEEARAHGNDPDAVRIRREEEGAEQRSGDSVSATGGRSDEVGGSPAREGEGSSGRREGEGEPRSAAGKQRQGQQGRGQEREQRGTRQAERGRTSIGEAAVRKIAGVAAQEVEKVQMGGGTAAAVSGFLGSVTGAVTGGGGSGGGGSLTAGVSAEVGEEEAAFDLTMAVEYGVQIPRTTEAVRQNVINRVENLTGLRVTEVDITVSDVRFPEERPQLGRQQEVEQQARE
jgi:uncharacterized alkaline shock family protein YloU